MIAGMLLAVIAAVAIVLSLTSGSSSPTSSQNTSAHKAAAVSRAARAHVTVAVLNGTEQPGLAHHTAERLQQAGFSQASALAGQPPGNGQTSIVQYRQGSEADARAVARTLKISTVQPLEPTVQPLVGSAGVVVIVGQDLATAGT
jgi:hypothetical protein